MTDGPGEMLAGRYRILAPIGRGGMGAVWRAWDTELDRTVAIKEVSLPEYVAEEERRVLYARMQREARAAARLKHPGIVTVHDRITGEDGRPWIVMEYIQGGSLADLLTEHGQLPYQRVAGIGAQMLAALRVAHDQGIVHRDIKPANVLLEGDRVILTDFGIATLDGDATLTRSGAIIGTPAYMSPEQVNGQRPTPGSDLWSLGATLYAAVEGRSPFEGPSHGSIFVAIATKEPAPCVNAGPLTDILEGLLRKNPAERLSAAEAHDLLARVSQGAPPPTTDDREGRAPAPPVPYPAMGARRDPVPPPVGAWHPVSPAPPRANPRNTLLLGGGLAAIGVAAVVAVAALLFWPESAGPRATAPLKSSPARPTAPPVPEGITLNGSHKRMVYAVGFSPDNKTLASGSEDGVIRLWDVATADPAKTLKHPGGELHWLSFGKDAKTLFSSDRSGAVRRWDVTKGHAKLVLPGRSGPGFNKVQETADVRLSPDGKTLARSEGKVVRIWDLATGRKKATLTSKLKYFDSVAFSPDGKTVAGIDSRDSIQLWDTATGRSTRTLTGDRLHLLGSIAFSPDSKTLAVSTSHHRLDLWNVAKGQTTSSIANDGGGADSVTSMTFSPDGKTVVSSGTSGKILMWDLRTGRPNDFSADVTSAESLAISPDGAYFATGHRNIVRLWKVR